MARRESNAGAVGCLAWVLPGQQITRPSLPGRRRTRTGAEKTVLERGEAMVLAAHFTPVHGGLVARTVETVRFSRPERVDFRLVRGPVPSVVEEFTLTERDSGTRLGHRGEPGTDRGGSAGGGVSWLRAPLGGVVAEAIASVKAEAER